MQTLHLTNQPFTFASLTLKWLCALFFFGSLLLLLSLPDWRHVAFILVVCVILVFCGYLFMLKGIVRFTLTATHLQQHLFKGGWVIRWNDVEKIGICTYEKNGWHRPLPWIGIKLNQYTPYINSICPRVATELLLTQRGLLYLGAKQNDHQEKFENIVLASETYKSAQGEEFKGLQAMLANRMHYQRKYHGYDIFISSNDLDRSAEEFVGLLRRYLASATTTIK